MYMRKKKSKTKKWIFFGRFQWPFTRGEKNIKIAKFFTLDFQYVGKNIKKDDWRFVLHIWFYSQICLNLHFFCRVHRWSPLWLHKKFPNMLITRCPRGKGYYNYLRVGGILHLVCKMEVYVGVISLLFLMRIHIKEYKVPSKYSKNTNWRTALVFVGNGHFTSGVMTWVASLHFTLLSWCWQATGVEWLLHNNVMVITRLGPAMKLKKFKTHIDFF